MKKLTLMSVMTILCFLAKAQPPALKPLTVGDTVPDITIRNVYNYPDSVIKLSDLKGKLTILDFWATWCGACISSFPKMMDLKKTFGKDLDILCINSFFGDDHSKVVKSFANWRQRLDMDITLPYALKDTLLSQMFSHTTIPHYVWIGSSNRVLAITHRNEVTEENIRSVLAGKEISLYVKQDELLYDTNVPLFVNGNGGDGTNFLYRSILTPYNRDVGHVMGHEKNDAGLITKIHYMNTPLITLLGYAYPELFKYNVARTIFEVNNPERFKRNKGKDEENKTRYCYELICPPMSRNDVGEFMKNEFTNFFNVTVAFENRKVECWLLKANKDSDKLLSNSDSAYSRLSPDFKEKKFVSKPVEYLREFLEFNFQTPIIDETGIVQNIDMDFPSDFLDYNLDSLQSYLAAQGLILVRAKRNIDVAVITEKNFQNNVQN